MYYMYLKFDNPIGGHNSLESLVRSKILDGTNTIDHREDWRVGSCLVGSALLENLIKK